MANSRLEMTFKNQLDSKAKLSIDNPKADITELDVKTAMNDIIAKNIFNTSGGDLVGIVGARIVTTDVNELTL